MRCDRFKLFSRSQKDGEDFDHFITDLKMLAKTCYFGEQVEFLIRDRVVIGINDSALQERLIRNSKLKLQDAESLCRASEANKLQMKGIRDKVDIVKNKNSLRTEHRSNYVEKSKQDTGNKFYDCLKCGSRHKAGTCPASGKNCHICKGLNHFHSVGCKNKYKYKVGKKYDWNINEVVDNQKTGSEIYIDGIFIVNNIDNNQWLENVLINDIIVPFKLDTGGTV